MEEIMQTGENTAEVPADAGRETGENSIAAPVAGEGQSAEAPAASEKVSREALFDELVSGEYRDIYTKRTQEMIDRRFRKTKALEAENSRLRAALGQDERRAREKAEHWYREAQAMKTAFPDFDLDVELADSAFVAAINAGVPMELFFKGKYFDKRLANERLEAEKKLVENIRAKGQRPAENGTTAESAAFTVKNDPSKLSLAEFDELSKRAARGEVISF